MSLTFKLFSKNRSANLRLLYIILTMTGFISTRVGISSGLS